MEPWDKLNDGPLETCGILPTGLNIIMEPIHHRMPVILDPRDLNIWLDPRIHDLNLLSSMLNPYTPEEMEAYPVSAIVNNPRSDVERVFGRLSDREWSSACDTWAVNS